MSKRKKKKGYALPSKVVLRKRGVAKGAKRRRADAITQAALMETAQALLRRIMPPGGNLLGLAEEESVPKIPPWGDSYVVNTYRMMRRTAVGVAIREGFTPDKWPRYVPQSFGPIQAEVDLRKLKVDPDLDEALACIYRIRSYALSGIQPTALRDEIVKTLDAYGFFPKAGDPT